MNNDKTIIISPDKMKEFKQQLKNKYNENEREKEWLEIKLNKDINAIKEKLKNLGMEVEIQDKTLKIRKPFGYYAISSRKGYEILAILEYDKELIKKLTELFKSMGLKEKEDYFIEGVGEDLGIRVYLKVNKK